MARRPIYIEIVHSSYGTGAAAAAAIPATQQFITIQQALADMFARLRAGATMASSGYSYGLTILESHDGRLVGYNKVIYTNASNKIQDFIIRASKWWLDKGSEITSDALARHDQFVRRTLLGCTRHQLSDKEMAYALSMSEDDFLAAMALSLESDVLVTELFQN